jgi:hypothetical protein
LDYCIRNFYRNIGSHLSEEKWNEGIEGKYGEEVIKKISGPPIFWKAIGDEVIYEKTLSCHQDAVLTVSFFANAVNLLRLDIRGISPDLDIKATCWLAGFPITNLEIVLGPAIEGFLFPNEDPGDGR